MSVVQIAAAQNTKRLPTRKSIGGSARIAGTNGSDDMSVPHDEEAAMAELKGISDNAKMHLAHIVQNGFLKVLYAGHCPQVQKALLEFERDWREGTGL